ncbi:hypothetical protein JDN40_14345 [Rhodomicrobium vannielii ATCC 17100]|uniref:phage capsid protein n=1 Tax=Rhodomicrobium vannielii TaxID=1069 RepID=UPI00191AD23B|nr:phage capsid protein [Rhodomicrobium vannielii]MBJ7535288.1 hypothetical protein [Rhodomicrobium vannielii ATCC 17100]
MSNEALNWAQEQFDTRVNHVYQSKGYLTKGMTTGPAKIDGVKMWFNIAGKGTAQPYARGDQVKVMNSSRDRVSIDAREWDAADYVYDWDQDRIPVNEMDVVVDTASMALGRQHDTVLFDLVRGTDFSGQISGSFTAAFGPGEMLAARRELFSRDVPVDDGQFFCGLPPIVFDTMMSYEVFANSQWVGGNLPFADGLRKRSWQNINFFELPVYLQTIASSTQGKFYVWHKSALGTGHTGQPIKSAWEDERAKWKRMFYRATISGGATVILKDGVQECRYKADAAPTFANS